MTTATTFDATTLVAVSNDVAASLAAIENSEQAIISTRRHLADVLKSVEHCEWKALAKPLKRALSEAEKRKVDATGTPVEPEAWVARWTSGTVDQILGVMKACHEHRLVPEYVTSLSKFKKLGKYTDWQGLERKVSIGSKRQSNPRQRNNTTASNTTASNTTASNTTASNTTASTIVDEVRDILEDIKADTATMPTENAPEAQTPSSPASGSGSVGKADIPRVSVVSEDGLSPHEVVFLHLEHAAKHESGIYKALMESVSQALGHDKHVVAATIALKIADARKAMTPKNKR